jgi:hypothetical protein
MPASKKHGCVGDGIDGDVELTDGSAPAILRRALRSCSAASI